MSRTKHHRGQKWRHAGEDLWSRRAGMGYACYNAFNKWLTRRKERAAEKQANINELNAMQVVEAEADPVQELREEGRL